MRSARSFSSLALRPTCTVVVGCTVLVGILVMACGPGLTPEEQVEAKRAGYNAVLTSWTVIQNPSVGVSADGEEVDVDDSATPQEVRTEVLLDILVSTEVEGSLPGLTVDLTHVDSEEVEKSRRTLWIDTGSVSKGSGVQISHVLADVDYATGDMFHVEIRVSVPPQERSAYREFDP